MAMRERIIVDGIEVEGPEARRIVREAMRDPDGRNRPWRMLAMTALYAGVAAGLVGYLVRTTWPGVPKTGIVLAAVVTGVAVSTIHSHVYWHRRRHRFRAAMNRHGYALCTSCGYWLRGLAPDERCPECGAPRDVAPREVAPGEGDAPS